MSTINHIIEERPSKIGNFWVGRILPFRDKRMVGPFIFIDHMGPAHLSEMEDLSIGSHPHIGLSTLTYLLEGEIMHRDGLGTEQLITPGSVNWMTAGAGIAHSERSPAHLKNKQKALHGLQIWVALPKELEEIEPSFHHIPASELPNWTEGTTHFKLIAGSLLNKTANVPVHSPLYLLEIIANEETTIDLSKQLYGECGIYILKGKVKTADGDFTEKTMLVAENTTFCSFNLGANSRIYLFGGDAFPEERYIFWNFVSSSKERIEQAKKDWTENKFSTVPGETELIPLPANSFK